VCALKERTGGFQIAPPADGTNVFPSDLFSDDEDDDDEEGGDGSPRRPRRSSADKLRRWMADQRAEYKLYQRGQKSSMTEEKIARLQQIGFDWDTAPQPIGRPKVRQRPSTSCTRGAKNRA